MENQKTHWKRLINPDYIGAYSLDPGKDLIVKIIEVKREMIKGTGGKTEECTVAHLENEKPFILNITNQKTISKIFDSPYIEDWAGQEIKLFAKKERCFGENMEVLRVRPKKVERQKQPLTPERFEKALTAIEKGSTTKEKVLAGYLLTKEQIQKLG